MERQKKKHSAGRILLAVIAAALILATIVMVYSYFGGFGTGACADTTEFSRYAGSVANITIPENTRIVALGEATHGNAEFQQLKLEVFRRMVETYGVRAFALEGDFGGCEAVNRYIHGGNGTAAEAAAAIGFTIYKTEEMENLIAWMREYNDTAVAGDDLCFYGFDMQQYERSFHYLMEAAQHDGVDTAAAEALWDSETDSYSSEYSNAQREEVLTALKAALPEENAFAAHLVDVLLQNIRLGEGMDNTASGIIMRDRFMAENAMWILNQEQKRGNNCIFLSGHNGHVEQFGFYSEEDKVMGTILADELGEDYFVIGTDFYKTSCNLPDHFSAARKNHTFYSHDPLAKASYKCGFSESYLDFSRIPPDSALRAQVDDYTWMGSLGEGYTPIIMSLLPRSYRVWRSPATIYDAMIFVAYAHPTEIRSLES